MAFIQANRSGTSPEQAEPKASGLTPGVFIALTAAIVLLRLPSLFEPPWHTDEGIFAAVAQRVLTGGELYAEAWESKPPLFLYLYVVIFKVFGVGVLQLHLAATLSALASQWALYLVARRIAGHRVALLASLGFGVLAGLPFWEGTLALTEIFAVLPSILLVWCVLRWESGGDATERGDSRGRRSSPSTVQAPLRVFASRLIRFTPVINKFVGGHPPRPPARGQRPVGDEDAVGDLKVAATANNYGWLLLAGILLAIAVLLRQTTVMVGVAAVLWLMLRPSSSRGQDAPSVEQPFPPWLTASLWMSAGFLAVMLPVLIAFAIGGTWQWFWDANAGFFLRYIPSGEDLPFYHRPVILLPPLLTIACLWYYRKRGESPRWSLPALWLSMTLATALLTGRPYSHYMLQAFPPFAILVAMALPSLLSWRPKLEHAPAIALAASFVALWVLVVTPAFHGNPIARRYTKDFRYYSYFARWAIGEMSDEKYKSYFDVRVPVTEEIDSILERYGEPGDKVYIWGEYPWVYPLANVEPADRYMTSFYVLLIPFLDTRLKATLMQENPDFIVMATDARVKLVDSSPVVAQRYRIADKALTELLAIRYEKIATEGKATVYRRMPPPSLELPDSWDTLLR